MSDEKTDALVLAERILDRPGADPDDDLAMLARQLIRATERAEQAEALVGRLRDLLGTFPAWKHDCCGGPCEKCRWIELVRTALADPIGARLHEEQRALAELATSVGSFVRMFTPWSEAAGLPREKRMVLLDALGVLDGRLAAVERARGGQG